MDLSFMSPASRVALARMAKANVKGWAESYRRYAALYGATARRDMAFSLLRMVACADRARAYRGMAPRLEG